MNMGTPAWPESLEHFGTKAAMLSHLRTAILRGAIWGMVREPQHDGCNGGPVVVNLTAGVTDVYVERPYDPGGFIPDLTLQRQDPHLPTFIEVEVTSPASKRKGDYCREHRDKPVRGLRACSSGQQLNSTPVRSLGSKPCAVIARCAIG